MAGRPWTDPGWPRWLRAQRYDDLEIRIILDGSALPAYVAARASENRPIAGLVVAYLSERAPRAVQALDRAPVRYLSPAAFGRRLERTGDDHDLGGPVLVDVLTGARWWGLVDLPRLQAGYVVAAAALYRAVGEAAPVARLVELAGARAVAWPALAAWERPTPAALVERWGADLAAGAPADALVGNSRIPGGVWARAVRVLNHPPLLRADLCGCMGYRSRGRRDPEWGPVPPAAVADPRATPCARRVAALTVAQLRQAVRVADLEPADAATLFGTLIARRELIAREVPGLTVS